MVVTGALLAKAIMIAVGTAVVGAGVAVLLKVAFLTVGKFKEVLKNFIDKPHSISGGEIGAFTLPAELLADYEEISWDDLDKIGIGQGDQVEIKATESGSVIDIGTVKYDECDESMDALKRKGVVRIVA